MDGRFLEASEDAWIDKGGWVIVLIGLLAMFWALAVVVEEFFVPALNIMCVKSNIPDNVAGATFMAAGASSPELFASIIALFLSKSALGAGTIIGSEIFNHLIICAGSILYSKGGVVEIEPRIVMRECIFYLVAMGLLFFVLMYTSDNTSWCAADVYNNDDWNMNPHDDADDASTPGKTPWDDDAGEWVGGTHVKKYCVSWWQSLVLIFGYVIYALVCAYFTEIVDTFCPFKPEETALASEADRASMGSRASYAWEPVSNFQGNEDALETVDEDGSRNPIGDTHFSEAPSEPRNSTMPPTRTGAARTRSNSGQMTLRQTHSGAPASSTGTYNQMPQRSRAESSSLILAAIAPSHIAREALTNLNEFYLSADGKSYSCWLWKKSKFYTNIQVSARAWQLRWCTIDEKGFRSIRDRANPKQNVRPFNIYESNKVEIYDPIRMIIKLYSQTGNLYFQAPSKEVLDKVFEMLQRNVSQYSQMDPASRRDLARKSLKPDVAAEVAAAAMEMGDGPARQSTTHTSRVEDADDDDEENDEDLMALPTTCLGWFFHIVLFPLKFLLYYTVPDVRKPENENRYWTNIVMSVFWLAVLSYIMTMCVEKLGDWLGLSALQVGIVFSAAGTSFPNVFASMVVARQGLGNMAISNALGGNVFNIFMGMGIPFFLYSLAGPALQDPDRGVFFVLNAGGIVFPLLILIFLLLAFIVLLICSGWKLYKWHAYVFIVLYIAFVVWMLVAHQAPQPEGFDDEHGAFN